MTTLIVDGNLIANRSFFTPQGALTLKDGTPSGVIMGVLKSLQGYLQTFHNATRMVVVWDGGKSEWRKAIYPGYKAQRGKDRTPEEQEKYAQIYPQMDILHGFLPTLGVYSLKVQGQEGDDLAYACTQVIEGSKVIISSDKDLLQLVDKDTVVYRVGKDKIVGMDDFKDELGVTLHAYLGYRALVGDSSDNIVGVAGIGEKTAASLMEKYGHIDNILNAKGDDLKSLMKSKRTAKIFDKENLQVIGRNHKIMNLKYVEWQDYEEYLRSTLNAELEVNSKAVREFLIKWQMNEILSNYLSFINCFNGLGEE